MERLTIAIIGGGASGLFLASKLAQDNFNVILLERNDRLGKKLSSTGNGQGNLTNANVLNAEYFTTQKNEQEKVRRIIQEYDNSHYEKYVNSLGVLLTTDERGRVYPAGRQASAVTDALRFFIAEKGVDVRLQSNVVGIDKNKNGFTVEVETAEGRYSVHADKVALCAGGKAAKNFGTDGTAYKLAEKFGHTVTALYPSLVQLKTDTTHIKTLKGIRINDGGLSAYLDDKTLVSVRGDIIFTDYGVSGDAVFRASAFITDKTAKNVKLTIDVLPDYTQEEVFAMLCKKRETFSSLPFSELLCGMVNNQIGRAIIKRAEGDLKKASELVKAFPLQVIGSLSFDYAQVTKGGIPLAETDETLQSNLVEGLYLAGEILDVDGQCGGYNLQWAYSSACVVADAIKETQNSK